MKQEIKDREILFRCNCGHAGFFGISTSDCFGKGSMIVEMIEEPDGLTYRIKQALKYIFFGGRLFYKDIILNRSNVKKLKEFLNHETLNKINR